MPNLANALTFSSVCKFCLPHLKQIALKIQKLKSCKLKDPIEEHRLSSKELEKVLSKLSAKQRIFCEEFVIDGNGTQAAIRAGYSKAAAKEQASRSLTNVNVSAYVNHLRSIAAKATGITAQRILEEYAKIAFADLTDFVEEDEYGALTLKSLSEMKNTPVLKSIRKTKTGALEVTGWDKLKALQDLGRHVGLFTDKVDLTTNGNDLPPTEVTINVNHRKPGFKLYS